jgi:hypothetical protein
MSDNAGFIAVVAIISATILGAVVANVRTDTPADCVEMCGPMRAQKYAPDGTCECEVYCPQRLEVVR